MAESGIKFTYLNGGPDSITSIICLSSSPYLKGSIRLNTFTGLTSFDGGDNGLEVVTGFSSLTALSSFKIDGTNTVTFNLSTLPVNLRTFSIRGSNTTFGNISSLKPNLKYYYNFGETNTTTGNLSNLKPGLIEFHNYGRNTITGSIEQLPPNLTYFNYTSFIPITEQTSVVTGNLSALPQATLVYFYCGGINTTTGNLSSLPRGLITFVNFGDNTTHGSISALPSGLTKYRNGGDNTTYGNISALPTGLTLYENLGKNTTTGDISALRVMTPDLTYYRNGGDNTTYGNISALPTGLTLYENIGLNTTTGNLSNLPPTIQHFRNAGISNTAGDIKDLPSSLTLLSIRGSGAITITGNISALKPNILHFIVEGQNTITGDISALRTRAPELSVYNIKGYNTTTGNISSLPSGMTTYVNEGSNTTTGSYIDLPRTLTYYDNRGLNTVSGLVRDLPTELITFRQFGKGQIVGNITDLSTPKLRILDVSSVSNTTINEGGSALAIIQGDIAEFKNTVPVIESIRIQTGNTVTGNVSSLIGLNDLQSLNIRGDNTVVGDIDVINSLPSLSSFVIQSTACNITGNLSSIKNSSMSGWFEVVGNITGDIADLPTQLEAFVMRSEGNSTIYGNLSTLPSNIYVYQNTNINTRAFSYYDGTGGKGYGKRLWRDGMHNITLQPSGNNVIPVTHLVTLLVDLSGYTWAGRSGIQPVFNVGGLTKNPTINTTMYPEAAAAITALQAKGVTVTVNVTP